MAKIHLVISEDEIGHVHIDGIMTSKDEANKAAKYIKSQYGRTVRVESRETNNTLGFLIGYWHTKRGEDGKVTHTAQMRIEPFKN